MVTAAPLLRERCGHRTRLTRRLRRTFLGIGHDGEDKKFRAIYELHDNLSRLPGLSFLRDIARAFYSVDRTQRQIERAGQSAKNLKEKMGPKSDDSGS